jgi:DNA modification methylase
MSLFLHEGDCLSVLKTMPSDSVDSVITDPPAGISFMGKTWDSDKGGRDYWIAWMMQISAECLRVIKPGGHAVVWALPRTSHWTATAWENAG